MQRSRLIYNVGIAVLAIFTLALPAKAGTIAADALPLPNRVAGADFIAVGKVTGFEEKTVMAAAYPGAKNKIEFKIAELTLADAVKAPKGTKTIRVGFVPTPPMVFISPRPFEPMAGQEGCFFLMKNGEADFYVAAGPLNFIDKKSPSFDKDIALIKRCHRLLADPITVLKGKHAEDRFLTAGMLLAQYRTRKSSNPKTEPIEAEESKLILEALAAADWTPSTDIMKLSPLMVLNRLPLTVKDGWTPPKDQKELAAYAQQWVKGNAGTYRIERFVAEKDK